DLHLVWRPLLYPSRPTDGPIKGSRMKHQLVCLSVVLFLLATGFTSRADLQSDIQTVLKDKQLEKAEVGVEIIRLGEVEAGDTVLFGHNAEKRLIPASNLKLVTTASALYALGPDFKFRTLLLKHNDDLVLIGDGDPSLGDSELLR